MGRVETVMEQFEKVCKGLQTAVDSDWMWRKADYIAMCCKDALTLIRQQQDRIKELEAAIAEWEKFAPFLYVHGMLPEPPKEDGQ